MSDTLEFLQSVLPDQGYYCLAKPFPNGGYGHQTFDTVEALSHAAATHSNSQTDIFFTVGSLKQRKVVGEDGKTHVRTHANMSHHKALFVDLDCGATKDYKTQAEALLALKTFCTDSGWFKPTYCVNSGRGLHCYWVFDRSAPTSDWYQLAERFKVIARHFGLKADPVCTSDKARVLRVPGTFNWKNPDDPKPVKVLMKGTPYSIVEIQDKIKSILAEHSIDFKKRKDDLPEHLKRLFADKVSNLQSVSEVNIEPIYQKCQQMARIREVGGSVGYGMRSCAASIIKLSKEQDYSVLWSNDDNPDLVESQTQNMIVNSVTSNPSTCERFESFNCGGCNGCQFQGKIKSPISLGRKIKSVYDEPVVAISDANADKTEITDIIEGYENDEEPIKMIDLIVGDGKLDSDRLRTVPPPQPYVHTDKNTIFANLVIDGVTTPIEVADFVIAPLEVCKDKSKRNLATVKVFIRNGVDKGFCAEFPMTDLATNDGLRKSLASVGVLDKNTEKSNHLIKYMTAYIKHLQSRMKSVETHGALGWEDDDHQAFVLPSGVYEKDGSVKPNNTSMSANTAMSSFSKKGNLDEWKSVVNTYARKGYEDYAFAHLVGYGSIVFSISGYSGAVVSMVGNSGSGKSTILETINSVYGKPKNYLNQADTMNAKMNRLAVYKNIPVTYDEITNMQHDELSQFVYSVSQGRSKLRLDQNGNEKDSSNNSWQMILACTSNSNLVDKLSAFKQDASAESMRIFEFYINRREDMRYQEARKIFDKLQDNYGHAGEIFVADFVTKVDKVKALYDDIVSRLSNELDASSKERYWIAVAASVIAGGIISKRLGLHDFDMVAIYQWAVKQINNMRGLVQDNVKSPQATLVDFLNSILNRTLVLGGGVPDSKGKPTGLYPLVEPQDAVWARTEKDRDVMYVDQQKLRDYVTKGGSDFNTAKTVLVSAGIVMDVGINKVLTKDSNKARTGNTRCWKINLNHPEMADVKVTLVPIAAKIEGTEAA